jgi:ribose 5-phosphate isomerase RpiB
MIAIASDHGGYDLKERVKKYLEENFKIALFL